MVKIEAPGAQYIEDKDDIYEKIISDIDRVKEVFKNINLTAERNYNWYAGRQWTEEEIQAHYQQGREPYVFNDIKQKIDHLIGTESKTSLDVILEPREKGDDRKTQLLNRILKWVNQVNDFNAIRSEVYQDGVIRGSAPVVIKWTVNDLGYSYPTVETVPGNELYWDEHAKKIDMSDCRWIARVMEMTKLDAVEAYPDYIDCIDDALSNISSTDIYNVKSYRQSRFQNGRYWYLNEGRDIIRVIEHYENIKLYEYLVIDELEDKIEKFYTNKDAKNYLAGLIQTYSDDGIPITQVDGSNSVYINRIKINRVMQTLIIGDQVAYRILTNLNKPPYEIYFSNFNKGDYWSTVDDFISPQRLLNRSLSQYDYALGTSMKNMVTVMDNLLKKGFTFNDVVNEMSKTGPIVPVIDHRAINIVPNQQIQPALFETMQFSRVFTADLAGGRNAIGQNQYANESGKAVEARASQAGVSRLPLFDKLKMWTKQVTYQLLWWIVNYMTPAQIYRIIGIDDVDIIDLDDSLIDSLKELQYDIILDETSKSESVREMEFDKLYRLFQMTPGLRPETMLAVMLPFFNLAQKEKDTISNFIEVEKEYQQKQAEFQQQKKNEQEAMNQLEKRKIKEQILQSNEMLKSQQETEKDIKKATEFQNLQEETVQTNNEMQIMLQNLNSNLQK